MKARGNCFGVRAASVARRSSSAVQQCMTRQHYSNSTRITRTGAAEQERAWTAANHYEHDAGSRNDVLEGGEGGNRGRGEAVERKKCSTLMHSVKTTRKAATSAQASS